MARGKRVLGGSARALTQPSCTRGAGKMDCAPCPGYSWVSVLG